MLPIRLIYALEHVEALAIEVKNRNRFLSQDVTVETVRETINRSIGNFLTDRGLVQTGTMGYNIVAEWTHDEDGFENIHLTFYLDIDILCDKVSTTVYKTA